MYFRKKRRAFKLFQAETEKWDISQTANYFDVLYRLIPAFAGENYTIDRIMNFLYSYSYRIILFRPIARGQGGDILNYNKKGENYCDY